MKEKDEEDDIIEEEYDKLDDRGKMERDERILLPRLKGLLKFRGEKIQKLEEKIIKLNKIGQFKNEVKGNVTSLYKKIENIYKNNKYNNNLFLIKCLLVLTKNMMTFLRIKLKHKK